MQRLQVNVVELVVVLLRLLQQTGHNRVFLAQRRLIVSLVDRVILVPVRANGEIKLLNWQFSIALSLGVLAFSVKLVIVVASWLLVGTGEDDARGALAWVAPGVGQGRSQSGTRQLDVVLDYLDSTVLSWGVARASGVITRLHYHIPVPCVARVYDLLLRELFDHVD